VNDFVEQCRREWERLAVPGPVANEMAADLLADLQEAEAEGVSAEEVLGSGAFDPRAFAASWAAERGVSRQRPPVREPLPASLEPQARRSRPVGALAASVFVGLVGLALTTQRTGEAQAFHVALMHAIPPRPEVQAARVFVWPLGFRGSSVPTLGLLLVLLGVAGLIVSLLYWSPWRPDHRAGRRLEGDNAPGGASYS
jgi:hypothetical protein